MDHRLYLNQQSCASRLSGRQIAHVVAAYRLKRSAYPCSAIDDPRLDPMWLVMSGGKLCHGLCGAHGVSHLVTTLMSPLDVPRCRDFPRHDHSSRKKTPVVIIWRRFLRHFDLKLLIFQTLASSSMLPFWDGRMLYSPEVTRCFFKAGITKQQ